MNKRQRKKRVNKKFDILLNECSQLTREDVKRLSINTRSKELLVDWCINQISSLSHIETIKLN